MCPGEMRREAYFPIFIKALQKGGHMNQYLEQWVGKELTKELEEGIINAPQDLLGSHIYKEPGVQIFTAYRPCAWNVWLLDGKGEVVGEMEPMELGRGAYSGQTAGVFTGI